MPATLLRALASTSPLNGPAIRTTHIALPGRPGERIALHGAGPARPAHAAVLFVHGASFPTLLAAGFQFAPGDSWLQFMARQGYLACGLDLLGFGAASRPPAMAAPASHAPPLTDAREAAAEIALAVDALRKHDGISEVHVVAHSWGTVPAGLFAATHTHALSSLTLFGPIVPVERPQGQMADAAWWTITAQQRLEQLRFRNVLPPHTYLLEPAVDRTWAAAFAASVPRVAGDPADALRIPGGPLADLRAVSAGRYPYAPASVSVPVCIVYGNYDNVVDDAGAACLLAEFTRSPLKWRLRIDDGTHVMHLERNRHALYESVYAFIRTAHTLQH
jgi:pimeloyl-ACP methyl ester carboxylesterase